MESMEDRIKISLLMDFYSPLLTDKQKDVMEFYYNDDLSISEIAELNKTSRQATYDLIKRCYKLLLSYEEKLNLLQKSINRKNNIRKFADELKSKYAINDDEYEKIILKLEGLQ